MLPRLLLQTRVKRDMNKFMPEDLVAALRSDPMLDPLRLGVGWLRSSKAHPHISSPRDSDSLKRLAKGGHPLIQVIAFNGGILLCPLLPDNILLLLMPDR